eukprot:COSAG01_NODE_1217_length_11190_cov_69.180417_11_plen_53_part_00
MYQPRRLNMAAVFGAGGGAGRGRAAPPAHEQERRRHNGVDGHGQIRRQAECK